MKTIKVIAFIFLIVFTGYILYFIVGMSSTYSGIKEYSFSMNKISFEQKLNEKINSLNGWTFEKKDSVSDKNEACYWASLLYEQNEQKLEYDIKYCVDLTKPNNKDEHIELEIIGAFDHVKKSGGYKLSDKDVEVLLAKLDHNVFNEML